MQTVPGVTAALPDVPDLTAQAAARGERGWRSPGHTLAALLMVAALLRPQLAHAYIDPNTGGWLFQMLMPAFTAAMGAWLLLRRWIAEQLRRLWRQIAARRRD